MQQIFISYAQDQSHGQRLAEQVQALLHGEGFTVFRDVNGILPGAKWADAIERQLKASQLVVLVVSSKALNSDWVFSEFDMAKECQIPVIPIFAEALSAPLWLRYLQRLDFSDQPDWQRLIDTIGTYIPLPIKSQSGQPQPSVSPLPSSTADPTLLGKRDGYGRYDDVDGITVIRKGARDVYGGYDDVDGITVIRKGARGMMKSNMK